MKKTLFFIMAVALCTSLMSQSLKRQTNVAHQSVPYIEAAIIGAGTQDADATIPMHRSSMVLAPSSYLEMIGQTHYYQPTNTNARNTVTIDPNTGSAAAVWIMASALSSTRGTGINYLDAGGGWRPMPDVEGRIEKVRTGWGTHGFTAQGEIVVSHNGNANNTGGIVVNTRDKWGEGEWNEYVLKCSPYTMSTDWAGNTTYEATGIMWPTMVTNGNTVHMVAVTEQAPTRPSGVCDFYVHGYEVNGKKYPTVPLYYRSSDGGKTWDIKEHNFHAEGMTEYEMRWVSGDNYVLAVRDEHIVFLYCAYFVISYMESRDNGVTWQKKEVYDAGHFIDVDVTDIPARLTPQTSAIFIDENHKVHVAFGTQVNTKREGGCSWNYWPGVPTGIVYWNDSHDPISWEDIAGNEDDGSMLLYDPLHKWFSYPRYIDIPTVLGYDRFYIWNAGPGYSTNQFRDAGFIAFPRIVAQNGKVYISYQAPLEWPLSTGDFFHRGVFVTVSDDDGETWDVQKNTSWVSYHDELFMIDWSNYEGPIDDDDDDLEAWSKTINVVTKTENAYPTMSTNIYDGQIILQWHAQEKPFENLTDPFTYYPSFIYAFTQDLWKFPGYANIDKIWQGLGVPNVKPTVNATIYPNPAVNGIVNVRVDTHAPYTLTVTNIMGQVVHTMKAQNEAKLNVSNYAPGIYIVNVRTANAVTSQKLIVK